MKNYFILEQDPDVGNVLLIVTEDDYNAGYNMSLSSSIMTDNLYDTFDELGCAELQDGMYEVTENNLDEIRKTLTDLGFEEKNVQ